jgi:hypothetical protein
MATTFKLPLRGAANHILRRYVGIQDDAMPRFALAPSRIAVGSAHHRDLT